MKARALVGIAATVLGCTGSIGANDGSDPNTTRVDPNNPTNEARLPITPRVVRLTDRQLANAIRDLLGLDRAPVIATTSGGLEEFIPSRPAAVNGGVALKLRDVIESLSGAAATRMAACTGDERACATELIERFGKRVFRRPIDAEEKTALLTVYDSGRTNYGGHTGGVRLVIEALLQAPSFLYVPELGEKTADGKLRLSPYEHATKLALFLRDSVPDEDLWRAAEDGSLATDAGLDAQIERLFAKPEVKANVSRIFVRMFQLDRLATIAKDASITEFNPTFVKSLYAGTERFLDDVLWNDGAKLSTLLTSNKVYVDKTLAPVYGAKHTGGDAFELVSLPNRAGILTQPSMLTLEATPKESSVVHRGVFVLRELLCFHPPPPRNDDLAFGEELKRTLPTERARAEKRGQVPRCKTCHGFIDPLGVPFEHYDTLGRFRAEIPTEAGAVPVDASWDLDVYDVKGRVENAVQLAGKLAESRAVRSCLVRQIASYAYGVRLLDEQMWATQPISAKFDAADGNLLELVKAVARWPSLVVREDAP